MRFFLTATGVAAWAVGLFATTAIKSDIQIILIAILLLGGAAVIGIASILAAVERFVSEMAESRSKTSGPPPVPKWATARAAEAMRD